MTTKVTSTFRFCHFYIDFAFCCDYMFCIQGSCEALVGQPPNAILKTCAKAGCILDCVHDHCHWRLYFQMYILFKILTKM